MARRHNYGNGSYQDRWQDGVDDRFEQMDDRFERDEDRMYEMALALKEVKEWLRGHDQRHADERETRQRTPDEIRGWIATAISIFTLLLMLYLQSQR